MVGFPLSRRKRPLLGLPVILAMATMLAFGVIEPPSAAARLAWNGPMAHDNAGSMPTHYAAVACALVSQCTAVDETGDEVTFDPRSGDGPQRRDRRPRSPGGIRADVPVGEAMHRGRSGRRARSPSTPLAREQFIEAARAGQPRVAGDRVPVDLPVHRGRSRPARDHVRSRKVGSGASRVARDQARGPAPRASRARR